MSRADYKQRSTSPAEAELAVKLLDWRRAGLQALVDATDHHRLNYGPKVRAAAEALDRHLRVTTRLLQVLTNELRLEDDRRATQYLADRAAEEKAA